MCQFLAYVGIIFFGRNISHSFFVTVSRADYRAPQRASDEARQPGNLAIIPAPCRSTAGVRLPFSLGEKNHVFCMDYSALTVFGSKNKYRAL